MVHGTVDGEIIARDLFLGPTGSIKGVVSVDHADIQWNVFQQIEAKVCLSLRNTGRIEGTAIYGDIEIEKSGVLIGEVSTIKGSTTIQALPRQIMLNNSVSTSSSDKTTSSIQMGASNLRR